MTPTPMVAGTALARALLQPSSIALVGASDDVRKMGGRPVQFLQRAGYRGKIYPINPKRDVVQGIKAWPSVSSLPEVPEHAFILTPTDTVIAAVRECAQAGVQVVTILASGFSESGAQGAQREAQLRKMHQQTGIRVLGPSSLGVVNPATGLMLTANAAFAEPDLPGGHLFVASQSGSMIGALVSRGKARGIGFAALVSVGSEVDLSIGEICHATLDDPNIHGYLLFLESMRHGRALRDFALAARQAGKPVVAYKIGRSPAAAEMAVTHTGALAGEDDVADAFFKDLGVVRVGVLDALLEAFPLARHMTLDHRAKRVGVVTTTGGGAAMVVDQLGLRDVTVKPPGADTLQKLAQAGLPCTPGRVLDLTLAGTRYEVMQGVLSILQTAAEFDLILVVVGSSARFQPELAVKPILDCDHGGKPVAVMLVPDAPDALATLTAAGVPCFRSPESCADAIAAVLARRGDVCATPAVTEKPFNAAAGPLTEAEAYAVLEPLGVPCAPHVTCRFDADAPDLPFSYPVVVKVCSADIAHKTEVGGVQLGIQNRRELQVAIQTLQQNLRTHAPTAQCETVLIQPMQQGLGEALIGYRLDPDAGPIVMLAAGGIWAEITQDRSIRLAPVTVDTARHMIAEVKAFKALMGARGKPQGDLDALAQAVRALSQLAHCYDVREAEVNPVLIGRVGEGVTAVDALVFRVVV